MRWRWKVLLTIVLVVGVPVGGLWLWGRPRAHVELPTATTTPADVVRAYAHAMNERDYGTCKRMGVDGAADPFASWATLHGPQIRDLKIAGLSSAVLSVAELVSSVAELVEVTMMASTSSTIADGREGF